jgi:MFS-type transporter involved in bile tolerance (Atg22 family)
LISLAIAVPVFGLPSATWWIIGLAAGSFYGAIWVSDRPLVVTLAPTHQLNSVFGMYMTVGRLGYAVGSACWSLVAVTFGWGQPAAMGVLLICTVIAIGFMVRLLREPYGYE